MKVLYIYISLVFVAASLSYFIDNWIPFILTLFFPIILIIIAGVFSVVLKDDRKIIIIGSSNPKYIDDNKFDQDTMH